ncbi:MAG TPA: hypothetical protein VMK65_10710 [Longimicrobiales bacterium]|nr:hypothetical protein [Longimicrobiales bacterium]
MPVIVNELEVVVTEPSEPGTGPGAGPQLPQPTAPAPGPLELAALLERRARQALRVFAH